MDIYSAAVQTLKPSHIIHERSHLYILMSKDSLPLMREFRACGGHAEEILDEETQLYYYHVPFGYTPYWQRCIRKAVEDYAWEFYKANEFSGKLTDWSDENFERTYKSVCKVPPHKNFYPMIRVVLHSILSAYPVYEPVKMIT